MQGDVWAAADHCFQLKAREQREERDRDNPGHNLRIQIFMKKVATQLPAHSLPDSSHRLVKLMETIVQSQSSILSPVLGGDSSIPNTAEMSILFFWLRVSHLFER